MEVKENRLVYFTVGTWYLKAIKLISLTMTPQFFIKTEINPACSMVGYMTSWGIRTAQE